MRYFWPKVLEISCALESAPRSEQLVLQRARQIGDYVTRVCHACGQEVYALPTLEPEEVRCHACVVAESRRKP